MPKNKQSNVSTHLQQKIPSSLNHSVYVSHEFVTQDDTNDKTINLNLINDNILFVDLDVLRDTDKRPTVVQRNRSIEFIQPTLTSNKSQYDKVSVLHDYNGNALLFDSTQNNERIFLKHISNSYLLFDVDGSFISKSQSNSKHFVELNYQLYVKGDSHHYVGGQKIESVGAAFQTVKNNLTVNIGGVYSLYVNGSQNTKIDGSKLSLVGGDDVEITSGLKTVFTGSGINLNSKSDIIISGRTVIIDSGSVIMKSSSMNEIGGGVRRINAEQVDIAGTFGVNISSTQRVSVNALSMDENIIGTALLDGSLAGKKTSIKLGNYTVKTLIGDISHTTFAGSVTMENLLSKVDVGKLGDITIQTPTSKIVVTTTGAVSLECLGGKININQAGIMTLDATTLINLSEGADQPIILGIKFLQKFLAHTHGTGVGPSTPPIEPIIPTDVLSTKVMAK